MALAVTVLLLAGLGTALAAGQGPMPGSFGVVAPRSGDAGTYEVDVLEGDLERHPLRYTFSVDHASFHAPDGRPDAGLRLHEERVDLIAGREWVWWQDVHIGDRADMTRLLWMVDMESGWRTNGVGISGGIGGSGPPSTVTHTVLDRYGANEELCGMRNGLQGGPVDTGTPVLFRGTCGASELVAWAATGKGSPQRVVYADPEAPDRLQVWMQADVPYPVLILEQRDGGLLRTRLVAFDRGLQDLEAAPVAALPAVAPGAHGMPTGEGLTPYVLPAALTDASSHPDGRRVADWLALPDAYVMAATYMELEDPDLVRQQWQIVLSNGQEAFGFQIARDRPPEGSLLPRSLDLARPDVQDNGHLTIIDAPGGPYPARSALPRLPDAGAVEAAYRAWSEAEPQALAFAFTCVDADCTEARGILGVGRQRLLEHAGNEAVYIGGITHAGRLDVAGDMLWYDARGNIDHARYVHQDQTLGQVPLLDAPPAPESTPSHPVARASFQWTLPPAPAAAGAGALAVLAGLLYALWPQVKQVGFSGLFSRVTGPRLLQHPLRAQVHTLVEAQPGIGTQAIAEQLGRSESVVRHHLRKMVESDLVRRVDTRNRPGFFATSSPTWAASVSTAKALAAMRAPGVGRVLQALGAAPDTVTGLSQRLSLSPGTVAYHLRKLLEEGVVERARSGRRVEYRVREHVAVALTSATG